MENFDLLKAPKAEAPLHPPGISYEYQSKGVPEFAIRK